MVHIWGITEDGIRLALEKTNKIFSNNIQFKRIEKAGQKYIVTLTVKNSKYPGSRIGFTGKRICAACWHVYGIFFEELFYINPAATIKECGNEITRGVWKDRNIGSIMNPLMYSQACDCEKDAVLTSVLFKEIKNLNEG